MSMSISDDLRGEVEARMREAMLRANPTPFIYSKGAIEAAVSVAVALVQEKVAEERKARGHFKNCWCRNAGKGLPALRVEPEGTEPTVIDGMLCYPAFLDKRCAPPDKPGGERE